MDRKSKTTKTDSQKTATANEQSEAMSPPRQTTTPKRKTGSNSSKNPTSKSDFSNTEHQTNLKEKIRERAHQISLEKDNSADSEIENWLQAEREIKDEKWKTDNYSQNL